MSESVGIQSRPEKGKLEGEINPNQERRFTGSRWIQETLARANLVKLGLISIFLASVDTIQSYYLQRVVNQFSEANLLPLKFYNIGPVGYALYFPIDFLSLFATLTVLWIWASYILWYHKHVIVAKIKVNVP